MDTPNGSFAYCSDALDDDAQFGFAGVPNAPNIILGLFKHKERARESPLGFYRR